MGFIIGFFFGPPRETVLLREQFLLVNGKRLETCRHGRLRTPAPEIHGNFWRIY